MMLRIPTRMIKSLINMRRSAILVVIVAILTVFATIQVLQYSDWCPKPTERIAKSRHKGEDSIDPKFLAELKKRWFLEYEEEKKLNENENMIERGASKSGAKSSQSSVFLPIDCSINGDAELVGCLREKDSENIYMPWTFIKRYFEVYGKVNHYDGYDRFEFLQCFAEVFYKHGKQYKYDGVFMTFETYNVEVRDRVKLITGVGGVPLSTQWGAQGYFYPIQIAQFALSHLSKNLTEKPASKTIYEDGEMTVQAKWTPTNTHCRIENVVDHGKKSRVMKFNAPVTLPYGSGIALTLGNTVDFELSFDIKFMTNGSFTVVLDTTDKKKYYIHYVTNKKLIDFDKDSSIMYGIGDQEGWRHFSRNLLVDLRKGVGMTNTKAVKKMRIGIRKVVKLILRGEGFIDNVKILTADHMTHFIDGSYWLLKNQDQSTGGWPIQIERRLEGFDPLPPGWHSAMAQGHGLSTMVRAYKYTRDPAFLKALQRALKPYTLLASEGGVKAIFMNKYVWYEEYPTTPSSFVLNGFIFSLLGLYDYKMMLSAEKSVGRVLGDEGDAAHALVTELYDAGMTSLKKMLPLYDGGAMTIYDLRHFQLGRQPNIARWDYHATHVSQLALLATIDDDPIFENFYENWMGYVKGIRAKHN